MIASRWTGEGGRGREGERKRGGKVRVLVEGGRVGREEWGGGSTGAGEPQHRSGGGAGAVAQRNEARWYVQWCVRA